MKPLPAALLFALACWTAGFLTGESAGAARTPGAVTAHSVNRDAKADRRSSLRPNLEAGQLAAPPGL